MPTNSNYNISPLDYKSFNKGYADVYSNSKGSEEFEYKKLSGVRIPTNGFGDLLKRCDGRDLFLVDNMLRSLAGKVGTNSVEVSTHQINKNNINEELIFSNNDLISLEINLEELTAADLQSFLKRYRQKSFLNIHFTGKGHAASYDEVNAFISELSQCKVLTVAPEQTPEIRRDCHLLNYQNYLINQLNIEKKPDVWQATIDEWAKLVDFYYDDGMNNIYYKKPINPLQIHNRERLSAYDAARLHKQDVIKNINDSIFKIDDLFFDKMLEHLPSALAIDLHKDIINLILNGIMTSAKIDKLADYITANQNSLPFGNLQLEISHIGLIKTPEFLKLTTALNKTSMRQLKIEITDSQAKIKSDHSHITFSKLSIDDLEINMPEDMRIPITFTTLKDREKKNVEVINIQNKITANMRKYYLNKLHNASDITLPLAEEKIPALPKPAASNTSGFAKKIKLKEVMRAKPDSLNSAMDDYVKIEHQHNVEVEVEVEQQQSNEINVDANLEVNLSDQSTLEMYEGTLIDEYSFPEANDFKGYDRLTTNAKNYTAIAKGLLVAQGALHPNDTIDISRLTRALKENFFTRVPNGISYFTPEAAEIIAKNLTTLASFNIDNLPQNFILKKTPAGELVLDYDAYAVERKSNVFTPKIKPIAQAKDPIYQFDPETFEFINVRLKSHGLAFYHKRLSNMYIKYGEEGINLLFDKMDKINQTHHTFIQTIHWNYIDKYSQVDHLLEDGSFFQALDKIEKFSSEKYQCFNYFLRMNNTPPIDLNDMLEGFEVFWTNIEILCKKNKIELSDFVDKFSPVGDHHGLGRMTTNSLVYMERCLTVFNKTQNFSAQLACINKIDISNYGAYYAYQYQDYKLATPEMNLTGLRDRLRQIGEKIPYNSNYNMFTPELHKLMDYLNFAWRDVNKYTNAGMNRQPSHMRPHYMEKGGIFDVNDMQEYREQIYQFIGLQSSSVNITELDKEITKQTKEFGKNTVLPAIMMTALFVVSHDRYTGMIPLNKLVEKIMKVHQSQKKHTIIQLNQNLYELHKLDIKLSETELMVICDNMLAMENREFTNLAGYIDYRDPLMEMRRKESPGYIEPVSFSERYTDKLFQNIKDNKYGILKMLSKCQEDTRISDGILPYTLDTNELLAQDPAIALSYKEELPLFSLLISKERHLAYLSTPVYSDRDQKNKNYERVKNYLHQAATSQKPNNLDYAFKLIVQSENYFTAELFLKLFDQLAALPKFDAKQVNTILTTNDFTISSQLPSVFLRDSSDLKIIMAKLILLLDEVINKNKESVATPQEPVDEKAMLEELSQANIHYLNRMLNDKWRLDNAGSTLMAGDNNVTPLINQLKSTLIDLEFNRLKEGEFRQVMALKIKKVKDFAKDVDFDQVERCVGQSSKMVAVLSSLMAKGNFITHADDIADILGSLSVKNFDADAMVRFLNLMNTLKQDDYRPFLTAIVAGVNQTKNTTMLDDLITFSFDLNKINLPVDYAAKLMEIYSKDFSIAWNNIVNKLGNVVAEGNDKLVKFIIDHLDLGIVQLTILTDLIDKTPSEQKDTLTYLLNQLADKNTAELKQFIEVIDNSPNKADILEIILKSYASSATQNVSYINVDLRELTTLLEKLEPENLAKLKATAPANIVCLYDNLKARKATMAFDDFLIQFETAPFGKRDFAKQFEVSEVERVINSLQDMQNKSQYTYENRQQLMEAFLFVNKSGFDLPLYNNKAAKDLSNTEIKTLFQDLKEDKIPHLDKMQKSLYALALMRESMYRTTGQFPYSTQMIALIDCVMHKGDVISNIDTGQGKSLVDTMKSTLLWLNGTRVDLTTSSVVDAKRDIGIYSPFLEALGIPYSAKPILPTSDISDYKEDGINYSTFSMLSLFLSKARAEGVAIGNADDVVSIVMNESDHAILDDKIIYRYAASGATGVGEGNDWIYDTINHFIESAEFQAGTTSELDDIKSLRSAIAKESIEHGKSPRLTDKFSDEQLLMWLESAIIVKYRLRENYDYVIPPKPELKKIKGKLVETYAVKILMKDGKVSADTTYGNGMQQLLYARLNANKADERQFIIEPESKTIVSSNNKNLVDFYRSRPGYIWGSSGTVGSSPEIREQYEKYGFSFVKVVPHQANVVKTNKPQFKADEAIQFETIKNQLKKYIKDKKTWPGVVFCKDIETANRLYAKLEKEFDKDQIQRYSGVGNEEAIVKKAAKPGMITITTSALGRNTDILYNKKVGLTVFHTYIDSARGAGQKSGRTGRQGSPGEVHYILNNQELSEQWRSLVGANAAIPATFSIDEIRNLIDTKSAKDRQFNEELYDILGYFARQIDELPNDDFINSNKSEFIKKKLASLTDFIETAFRDAKLNNSYDRTVFVNNTVEHFIQVCQPLIKQDLNEIISAPDLLEFMGNKHRLDEEFTPAAQAVKIEDCYPEALAYQFIQKPLVSVEGEIDKAQLSAILTEIFSAAKIDSKRNAIQKYFVFINSNVDLIPQINAAYQEFMTGYLEKVISKKLGLTSVISNQQHHTVFKAMADLRNDDQSIPLADQKKLIVALLKEYLSNNSFINSDRKKAVSGLTKDILAAESTDQLFKLLIESQTNVIASDIASNRSFTWRAIKPLNYFGESRFQNTLTNAFTMLSALTGKNNSAELAGKLGMTLKDTVRDVTVIDKYVDKPSVDSFQVAVKGMKVKDKGNARVLVDTIDKVLKADLKHKKVSKGMAGRDKLFKKAGKKVDAGTGEEVMKVGKKSK